MKHPWGRGPKEDKRRDMSGDERRKALLFLALFFGAAGFLFTLLSCGTEYWLLGAESCSQTQGGFAGGEPGEGKRSRKAVEGVRIFHEGLFWRCSFAALSNEHSMWDLWIPNQPPSKLCQVAFLFPFPAHEHEHPSAIVFRTFWSIFLVAGLAAVVIGGFVVICASPLSNHKLFKVGGAFQICGGLCLLVVLVMYLLWVQVLDTLEQFAQHQRVSACPSFHLAVQHGPSFLLAPVAVFFSLLAGLLFLLVGGQSFQKARPDGTEAIPQLAESDV